MLTVTFLNPVAGQPARAEIGDGLPLCMMPDITALPTNKFRRCAQPELSQSCGCTPDTSVSYTHLDVYKRQTLYFNPFIF